MEKKIVILLLLSTLVLPLQLHASTQIISTPTFDLPEVGQFTVSSALGTAMVQGAYFEPSYTTPLYSINWSDASVYWIYDGMQFTFGEVSDHYCPPEVSPVPLPAAAWLFISAILGLIVIARRKSK